MEDLDSFEKNWTVNYSKHDGLEPYFRPYMESLFKMAIDGEGIWIPHDVLEEKVLEVL